VLSKFRELNEELINFFMSKGSGLADLLSDETWCNKFVYLIDISQASSTLNKSMYRENKNIRTCTNNIHSFQEKLTLWETRLRAKNKVKCFN
jgi:hypothetical protein